MQVKPTRRTSGDTQLQCTHTIYEVSGSVNCDCDKVIAFRLVQLGRKHGQRQLKLFAKCHELSQTNRRDAAYDIFESNFRSNSCSLELRGSRVCFVISNAFGTSRSTARFPLSVRLMISRRPSSGSVSV